MYIKRYFVFVNCDVVSKTIRIVRIYYLLRIRNYDYTLLICVVLVFAMCIVHHTCLHNCQRDEGFVC